MEINEYRKMILLLMKMIVSAIAAKIVGVVSK